MLWHRLWQGKTNKMKPNNMNTSRNGEMLHKIVRNIWTSAKGNEKKAYNRISEN